jgi:A/G-specific adenine glycosylase
VVEQHGGVIPGKSDTFRKLPGVGPYIMAAVLSIARGVPLPAVDGNVMRVYTRYRGIGDDIRKNTTKNNITSEIRQFMPADATSDFTQAFMELGALICTPKNPKCPDCPLQKTCFAFNSNAISDYPFKTKLSKAPEYHVSIAVIAKGNRFYIQKRPSKGHLGGLWEFPGGKAETGETPEKALIRECREELDADIQIEKQIATVKHAYSHFKINMSVFLCRLNGSKIAQPEGHEYRWITVDEIDEYPFPGANHKFFPQLRKYFQPRTDTDYHGQKN